MDFVNTQPKFCIKYGAARFNAKSSNIDNFISFMRSQVNPANQPIIESMTLIQDHPSDFDNLVIEVQSPMLFRDLSIVNQKSNSKDTLVFEFGRASGYDNTSRTNNHFEFGRASGYDNTSHADNHFKFGRASGYDNTSHADNHFKFGRASGYDNTSHADNHLEFGRASGYDNTSRTNNHLEFGRATGYDNTSHADNHLEFGRATGYDNTSHADNHLEFGNTRVSSTGSALNFESTPSNRRSDCNYKNMQMRPKSNQTKRVSFWDDEPSSYQKRTHVGKDLIDWFDDKPSSYQKRTHVGKECPDLIDWFDVISDIKDPDRIKEFYQMCKDQDIVFAIEDNAPIPRLLYISFFADEMKRKNKKSEEDARFAKLCIPDL